MVPLQAEAVAVQVASTAMSEHRAPPNIYIKCDRVNCFCWLLVSQQLVIRKILELRSMGDRVAYAALPMYDEEEVHHRDVIKDGDRQRDKSPEPEGHVAVKTSWPVKTRWLILALFLLVVPVVVPCSLAAVNGRKCPDYWKGAGVFLFCGTLWASEVLLCIGCSPRSPFCD